MTATRRNVPAPLFARGAGSGFCFHEETQARQRSIEGTIDLMTFAEDADGEEEVTHSLRKSPSTSRKSPSLRCNSSRTNKDPPPTEILDFLYLGSVQDAKNVSFLKKFNITQIINVSQEEYYSPDPEHVTVRWFYAEDTCDFDIQKYFSTTEKILSTARRLFFAEKDLRRRERVLVHCQKGRSRSATIVLAHLIRSNGWSVAEALEYVSNKREQVEPNLGFIEALRVYQESMSQEERTLQRSRRCLLIRNMLSNKETSCPLDRRTPHTPLEKDARQSTDGTTYPLLTLDVLKKFFTENVGIVVQVQVQVKTKDVEVESIHQEEETVLRTLESFEASSLAEESKKGPEDSEIAAKPTHGISSSADSGQGSLSESNVDTQTSATNIRRVGVRQVVQMKSAQILIEFACSENVDAAGMLKKTDAQRFLPICPNPNSLLFQKPSKTVGKKGDRRRSMGSSSHPSGAL